jgi:cysteine desulfurase / selenocysteine lyase
MPDYDLERYRGLFPHIKEGLRYFNHAAVSPFSNPVREAIQKYLQMKNVTNPEPFELLLKTMVETKEKLGRLINAPRDRIALLDNTSNGLNILATGIDWKAGDRILVPDIEFPSNVYPFMNLKRRGVEIDFVPNRRGRILPEDIERLIGVRTRLLSISHVQFLHGYRSDLKAISGICRNRGVIFSVDAIQSVGAIPVDVEQMGIDFLAAGGQKWLMGPEGIAFVYVSQACQERMTLGTMGWMNNKDFFSDFFRYRIDLDDSARRFENGTPNSMGVFGLNASAGLLLEVGPHRTERHLAELTQLIINRVKELGVELVSPEQESERAGIVTFRPANAQAMFQKLRDHKIMVSIREGCIRFSPHFYNSSQEIEEALDVAFAEV